MKHRWASVARQGERWLAGRRGLLVAACAISFAIALAGTHAPAAQLPTSSGPDKWLHLLGYGCLSLALVATLAAWHQRRKRLLIVWSVLPVYGALDELTQPWVNREASVGDWLANLGGIALGCLVFECLALWVVGRWAGRS